MLVRLLGPVEVVVDEGRYAVRGTRRSALLVALALRAREAVSADRLLDLAWGESPPPKAAATLQSHLSHLRRLLGGPGLLRAEGRGYVLHAEEPVTDAGQAQALLAEARATGDVTRAVHLLRATMALWRGPSLSGVDGHPWFRDEASRLEALRGQASRLLADHRLSLGEHTALASELQAEARLHPLDEDLHRQLMTALYRSGRAADALGVYHGLRRELDEALGVRPGQALRDLEYAILRQDRALDLPSTRPAAAPAVRPPARPGSPSAARAPGLGLRGHGAAPVVPHGRSGGRAHRPPAARGGLPRPAQLPPAPQTIGRERELKALDFLAAATVGGGDGADAAAPVVVVTGTAGVGKTTLVLDWARRSLGRFPDGQLYANLQGFGAPTDRPRRDTEVLHGFLTALGVAPYRIPTDAEQAAALFRSLVRGRQLLLVLDNARDARQVRTLLPAASECVTVITSRQRLTALVASQGARTVHLGVLPPADAVALLAHRIGDDRPAAEPTALGDLARRCAGLPLALSVLAALVRQRPSQTLRSLADELHDEHVALSALDAGEDEARVGSVLSWSSDVLQPGAAQLFAVLGLHPGPRVTLAALRSMASTTTAWDVGAAVTQLLGASLVEDCGANGLAHHDLLRAHAAQRAQETLRPAERSEVVRRMLDHYLHSAHAAVAAGYTALYSVPVGPRAAGVVPETPPGPRAARRWLEQEHSALIAVTERAQQDPAFEPYGWWLPAVLTAHLRYTHRWAQWLALQQAAVRCAVRSGDPLAQAHARLGLGRVLLSHRRHHQADAELGRALSLFTVGGDRSGAALTHLAMGLSASERQDVAGSLEHAATSVALLQNGGNPTGFAYALNNLAWAEICSGRPQQAPGPCERALEILRARGDQPGEAAVLDTLGHAHAVTGRHRAAVEALSAAITVYRAFENEFHEAQTLVRLGDAHLATGHGSSARQAWQRALQLLTRLEHPDAASLRDRLQRRVVDSPQRPR